MADKRTLSPLVERSARATTRDLLLPYLPQDRRVALAYGVALSDHAEGSVLIADIPGFTLLAERFVQRLGPQEGADTLASIINSVYGALIAEVERFGGSVIAFAGDAITCWFNAEVWWATQGKLAHAPEVLFTRAVLRATACGLALQRAMAVVSQSQIPDSGPPLALKVAIAAGTIQRFLVGDTRTAAAAAQVSTWPTADIRFHPRAHP
jgi:adenylate cyclase